jgi:hypothetical protein
MTGFRYRLLDEDGTDLGPFVTSAPNWRPGHKIRHGGVVVFEVVEVVDAEDEDGPEGLRGYLIVRPVGDAEV